VTGVNLYLWIDLAILAVPLGLSFDRKVRYVRAWPAVFAATLAVAAVFIPWDILKTAGGVWGFNARHVGRFAFFGLPSGELLFFLVVPFSCLFIFEVVQAYFRERPVRVARWVWLLGAAGLAVLGVLFRRQAYTLTVLAAAAGVLALAALWQPELLASFRFWLSMGLTYIPFLLFNGLLTSVPLVVYNDAEIWGVRVHTIPVEDFFYSFSLLGLAVLFYRPLRRRWVRAHG
jgi:lycopene cyclase domain-containing protein